jgi:hypothetical protein
MAYSAIFILNKKDDIIHVIIMHTLLCEIFLLSILLLSFGCFLFIHFICIAVYLFIQSLMRDIRIVEFFIAFNSLNIFSFVI